MQTIPTVFLLTSFLWCWVGYAQDLEVRIRTEKTVFFQNEPIPVRFTVVNHSDKPVNLKLSKHNFLNYYIEVFTLQRVSVKETDESFSRQFNIREILSKEKSSEENFRDFVLEPAQILGLDINLKKFYDLVPGTYLLKGRFYPVSSFYNPAHVLETPYIRIIVKEDIHKEQYKVMEREELKKELEKIDTPDDSVRAFFQGKIEKKWEKFFYVIDLRRLIRQFPVFYESFQKAADQEKNQVIQDFRNFLKELNSDEKIQKFEIAETIIRKNKAISTVIVTSRFQEMLIKREYRIGLILKDHWYLYGYTVIQK